MKNKSFRIGILGGMGPMAGVLLQKRIIECTPVKKDQEHCEVVCFTNPKIPDRTESFFKNGGSDYVNVIIESLRILEKTGVSCILIPCNTSHSGFDKIQKETTIPILNMIDLTFKKIKSLGIKKLGLLATDATIKSKIFLRENTELLLPDYHLQKEIMEIIYEIKSGKYEDKLILNKINNFISIMKNKGAEAIILGCTEFSIYADFLNKEIIIDPLMELAKEAVKLNFIKEEPIRVSIWNRLASKSFNFVSGAKAKF